MTTCVVFRTIPNGWESLTYAVYHVKDEDIEGMKASSTTSELYYSAKCDNHQLCLNIAVEQGAKEITRDIIDGKVTLPTLDQLGKESRYICTVIYNSDTMHYAIMPLHLYLAMYKPNTSNNLASILSCVPGYIYARLPTLLELEHEYKNIKDMFLPIAEVFRQCINEKLVNTNYRI